MAVLQMQRISICALKHDRKAILEKLQSMGMIEMHQVAQDEAGFEKMDTQSAKSSFEKRVQITENALDVLNQYTPEKKSMFASLEGRELKTGRDYDAFAQKYDTVMENVYQITALSRSSSRLTLGTSSVTYRPRGRASPSRAISTRVIVTPP